MGILRQIEASGRGFVVRLDEEDGTDWEWMAKGKLLRRYEKVKP